MEKRKHYIKSPKRLEMLLSVAMLISVSFITYSQIRINDMAVELDRVQLENEQLNKEAEVQTDKAIEMAVLAQRAEAEALRQKELADRALLELQVCKSK